MAITSSGANSMACSVSTINQVSLQSAKQTLRQYLSNRPFRLQRYDAKVKGYVACIQCQDVHVIFGGPDMATLDPKNGHYSDKGSCNQFAAFLEENKLGVVTRSPGRANPLHTERNAGEGELIIYIWSPDSNALYKWAEVHNK